MGRRRMFWVEKSNEFGVEFGSCMRFEEGGKSIIENCDLIICSGFYNVKKGERKGLEGRKGIKKEMKMGMIGHLCLGRCLGSPYAKFEKSFKRRLKINLLIRLSLLAAVFCDCSALYLLRKYIFVVSE